VATFLQGRSTRLDPRIIRSDSGAVLEVDGLYGRYADYDVIKGADLSVGEGEVVGLIGPNGAGKTTTLRAIMGLLKRRRGSVRVCGVETIDWPAHQIARGYAAIAPEGRRLFVDQRVRDNLDLGALHLRRDPKRVEALRASVYELFPVIKERRNELASSLSGGEAQMLAVGRMLMSDTRLLLLDEPSFGLAPLAIEALFRALDELRNERRSVLLVEQRVDLALRVCDRLYVLSGGRIVREQRVEDVKNEGRDLIDDYLG
jgi:branched-chain amino acid transport system ATP-binding protein